jgi:hypothetical protein
MRFPGPRANPLAYGWRFKMRCCVSRQTLVFQRVHRFAIQALRIAVDDLDITTVALIAFEARQVVAGRALKQSGAVFVYVIQLGPLKSVTKVLTLTSWPSPRESAHRPSSCLQRCSRPLSSSIGGRHPYWRPVSGCRAQSQILCG